MAPAAADKEVGNMKEVEDEASKVGEVYIDRILLLLYCVCIYIIIGEIERGEGGGADDIRAKERISAEHEPDGEGSSHHMVTGRLE